MGTGECRHCGNSFDGEAAYLRHLRDEHADELGRIEQRRVDEFESGSSGASGRIGDGSGDGGGNATAYALGLSALALGGLLAYLLFFAGGGATDATDASAPSGVPEPSAIGAVHYHGTIDATVAGEELDFSQRRFQLQADAFHFENGDGERWHVHARDVTLAYAMGTLGIDVTNGTVAYDGTTYGDDPDETVSVTVNGESVAPSEYVLQKGDHVRIVANGSASA